MLFLLLYIKDLSIFRKNTFSECLSPKVKNKKSIHFSFFFKYILTKDLKNFRLQKHHTKKIKI